MAAAPTRTMNPNFSRLTNTQIVNAGTGAASGANYMYVIGSMQGSYEIINQVTDNLSGPQTNPYFPAWAQSYVNLNIQTDVNLNAISVASGTEPSSLIGQFDKTKDNAQGGFDISGNLYTISAAELFVPITATTIVGTYTIDGTQQTVQLPASISTGLQSYQIMHQPGPWPVGIAANTSTTLPTHMAVVNAEQGGVLASQSNIAMNWSTLFSDSEG